MALQTRTTRRRRRRYALTETSTPHRLGVVIAIAEGSDLGPEGHHLRWFFPRSLGFPAEGCKIFRIPYEQWREAIRTGDLLSEADLGDGDTPLEMGVPNWSGRDWRLNVHPDLDLVFRQGTELSSEDGILQLVKTGGARNLLLQFRTPIIYVRIEMSIPSASVGDGLPVTGFHHSARLTDIPFKEVIELEQPGITDLLVPLAFDQIKRIVFVRETDLIEAKWIGQPARTLQLPDTKEDAYNLLEPDVTAGIANRMLETNSMDEVMIRYPPNNMEFLIDHLNMSVGNPDVTVTAPGVMGQAPFPVEVLDHLHFAALDPNIARMLASYWVDQMPGEFLYIVSACYSIEKKNLVYGFGFARHAAHVRPEINEPFAAHQLPGIDYRGVKPYGRVGLIWNRGRGDYGNPAKPVFVDVERSIGTLSEQPVIGELSEPLTKDGPQLIGSRSNYCFRDNPPAGVNAQYQVTPIDIFGRQGPSVKTAVTQVRDLEVPVPPKNIRAVIEQKGFPWQQPAQRKEPDIKRGMLAATAEFGEAQRRASPDAKEIRWRWRIGPLPDSASDPATWTLLATEKLTLPLEAKVVWMSVDAPTTFHLPVKDVRPVGTIETQRISERIAPLFTDAADLAPDATHADSGLLELLIDRPLLEPGIFDGYEIATSVGVVKVVGTHAGIAASDDDECRIRAARLVVDQSPAAGNIQPGDTITLRNPFDEDENAIQTLLREPGANHIEMAAPLVQVTLHAPLESEHVRAVGGEVAIDYHYLAIPETDTTPAKIQPVDAGVTNKDKMRGVLVGRLVSDVQSTTESSTFILRLKPADFLRMILIARLGQQIITTARFHAPNVLPMTTIGLNGEAGDIKIAMPLGKRYARLYLSATAVDAKGKESTQMAAPFEMRVVNPPPVVTPARPYPFVGGISELYGETSPPDHHGRSTVHVAWNAVDLGGASVDGIRYELARTLDTSIVASDRDRWRRGDSTEHFAALGIKVEPEFSGQLKETAIINQARGTFQVKVQEPNPDELDRLTGLSGRIRITHTFDAPDGQGSSQDRKIYHRLLKAVSSKDEVTLLCQPFFELDEVSLGTIKEGAEFAVQTTPDYSAVLADEGRLRQLADVLYIQGNLKGEGRNESAFGVVTGVPIADADFVDTIPGIGRSRFFYKVRAVFPGEVRSAWSPTSVAFRQIDLSQADAPEVVQVRRGATANTVTLTRPEGPGVRGIRLFSAPDGSTFTEIATFTFDPRDGEVQLVPAPLRPTGRLVDLRRVLQEARVRLSVEPVLLGIYDAEVDRDSPPAGNNLLPEDDRRVVRDIAELQIAPPADLPVVAQIESSSKVEWLTHIEAWVEINVELPSTDDELYVQTVKEISRQGSIVHLDSALVRLGGVL